MPRDTMTCPCHLTALRMARHARAAIAIGAAAVALGLLGVGAAQAFDENEWLRKAWKSSSSSWNQPFDNGSSGGFWSGSSGSFWGGSSSREKGVSILARSNSELMKDAIKRYAAVVKQGGWKDVPLVEMKYGSRGEPVARLRARLAATGDLSERKGGGDYYDYDVQGAVKRFQARHGLEPTGVLTGNNGKRTVLAMNVSANDRLKQLRRNDSRIRSLRSSSGSRYVLVNIPSQQIEAVEEDRVVSRHVAVVGKTDRPSPVLTSSIYEINFNKDWILPPTVVNEDLIPKGRRMARAGQNVLARYKIDAYADYTAYQKGKKLSPSKINWQSGSVYNYYYAQEPGPENPLGFVKINFGNPYDVYMHDTPSKTIFSRNFRAASSGCIRVQGIDHLVSWLIDGNSRDDRRWSLGSVRAMKKSGETLNVRLKKAVTVHFAYLTSWVGADGQVQFRSDLYGRDRNFGVSRSASAY